MDPVNNILGNEKSDIYKRKFNCPHCKKKTMGKFTETQTDWGSYDTSVKCPICKQEVDW